MDKGSEKFWDVWKTYYMTYAEIDAVGDKKPELVVAQLEFEEAQALVERLGFGYSVHPATWRHR